MKNAVVTLTPIFLRTLQVKGEPKRINGQWWMHKILEGTNSDKWF